MVPVTFTGGLGASTNSTPSDASALLPPLQYHLEVAGREQSCNNPRVVALNRHSKYL